MPVQIKLEARLVSWPLPLRFFLVQPSSWQGCCRAQHWQPRSGEDNIPKKEQGGGSWEHCPIQGGTKGLRLHKDLRKGQRQ